MRLLNRLGVLLLCRFQVSIVEHVVDGSKVTLPIGTHCSGMLPPSMLFDENGELPVVLLLFVKFFDEFYGV